MPRLAWQKSSYSNAGANCLNVAVASDGTVRLRDSDDPQAILSTTRQGLAGLVAALKGRRGPACAA
ncbi:DUF397 domain-containing protein [Streptomyces sp. WAC 06725]|uniref:DUF397 domain-containing protein n=1 Tax=Streptomyces sp. WAC 06725 TaxID=2203209 RepID=UPI000F73D75D|nr:DUF397 domain-containing protein [Streptomyces sp. WAC 06725]RSO40803.1 DUF397 domain-containing protein [Streptomyces sp. WAC 06725]